MIINVEFLGFFLVFLVFLLFFFLFCLLFNHFSLTNDQGQGLYQGYQYLFRDGAVPQKGLLFSQIYKMSHPLNNE